MNYRQVIHFISWLVALEGLAICASAGVGWGMRDSLYKYSPLLTCGVITFVIGLAAATLSRKKEAGRNLGSREGFAVVTLGWLVISIFGALPFMAVTGLEWYDALFETVSGFTTTGSTVIGDELVLRNGTKLSKGIESLSSGILFWRSLTHWIGGMGIVFVALAILPALGVSGQVLYNAEVPGVKTRTDQLTPRITSTAKIICLVYFGLTLVETLMLYFGGMTFFDAVCHSFGTISTGGFSTKNASIGAYPGSYIQLIIIIFMFLSGCNFVLHFRLLSGLPLKDYLNEEFRVYFLTVVFSSLLIGIYLMCAENLPEYYGSPKNAFLASAFQVVSVSTSTGFATGNFVVWPPVAGVILFGLMLMGGCGGSTAGGIKCMRMILLVKFSWSELKRHIFPHAVPNLRLNGERLSTPLMNRVLGFLLIYISTWLLFAFLLTLVCPPGSKMDLVTALTGSLTCISNIGPAFGNLPPDKTFFWLPPAAKLLMALEMLIGRLELFSVLILCLPSFWKR
ncbi:MAG: TrkH family potassium uptake protein [Lentisphaeria bacterium]|nr:TrkH family potassium uptake protein [Lentisphaeria bacterium]